MPCRDYDYDNFLRDGIATEFTDNKKKLDMLSRIACNALTLLEEIQETADKKLGEKIEDVLSETETHNWWPGHKLADANAKNAIRDAEIKKQATIDKKHRREILMSQLSAEDREILGIK